MNKKRPYNHGVVRSITTESLKILLDVVEGCEEENTNPRVFIPDDLSRHMGLPNFAQFAISLVKREIEKKCESYKVTVDYRAVYKYLAGEKILKKKLILAGFVPRELTSYNPEVSNVLACSKSDLKDFPYFCLSDIGFRAASYGEMYTLHTLHRNQFMGKALVSQHDGMDILIKDAATTFHKPGVINADLEDALETYSLWVRK